MMDFKERGYASARMGTWIFKSVSFVRQLVVISALAVASTSAFADEQFFGLTLGMSKEAVQEKVGILVPSPDSNLNGAFRVKVLPDENLGVPKPWLIDERTVYFDEEGKLWRIWVRIILQENTLFGASEALPFFSPMNDKLSLDATTVKAKVTKPHDGDEVSVCPEHEAWKVNNPEGFELAEAVAPRLSAAARVVFDIGCGAIPPWWIEYADKNPQYRHYLGIRDGNLYATPVIYAIAKVDDPTDADSLGKKIAKYWKRENQTNEGVSSKEED
jgi:hypothetical protein